MRSCTFALVVLLLVTPSRATSQDVLEALDRFPEPFSNVVGIRELPDGRILIADALEKHVSALDFATGELVLIGREGQGPAEYDQPGGLHSLPNGATLLTDMGNMRLTRIDAEGRLDETWPMMRQANHQTVFIRPEGTDRLGRVYFSSLGVSVRTGAARATAAPDSTPVLRLDLSTGRMDTAAMLFQEPTTAGVGHRTINLGGGGALRLAGGMMRPLRAQDGWGVTFDGRVGVVRTSDYRVDWYDTDGRVTRGPPTPYEPVRVTTAEKNAWADRVAQRTMSVRMVGGSGSRGQTVRMERPDPDELQFPAYMPPFGDDAVAPSADGEVWVRVARPSGELSHLYDVFDRTGHRINQVRLPANRTLLAVGGEVTYVVYTDDDELQWLERYRRP